jgi:hypothetical protein
MSRLARLVVVAAFALAALSQPLALDACSVSCEAARAAQTPAVAAPCHHTTSCASQISQPASPGSTAINQAITRPIVAIALPPPAPPLVLSRAYRRLLTSSSPPTSAQLRV